MAPRRCFSCTFSLRRVTPRLEGAKQEESSSSEAVFRPRCTCKDFVRHGACRHIPPAVANPAETTPAPSSFNPSCSCAAFKEKGTCRHLPPSGAGDFPAPPPPTHEESAAADTQQLPVLELPPFKYELHLGDVLGRGASGATVLRCTVVPLGSDEAAPLPCAAKVLPLNARTFDDMVEDFGREVSLMQGLQHPALVNFIGACRINDPLPILDAEEAYVLCLELCDDVLDRVASRRQRRAQPFLQEELGPIVSQVAAGLSFLHEHGVLHRDLKAANVFLQRIPGASGSEGAGGAADASEELPLRCLRAKLGDFGASKAGSRAQTPVQTLPWMAPEAFRQEGYGRPADVWGLGMLLYELLDLGVPYGEDITAPELEQELVASRRPNLRDRPGNDERAPAIVALMEQCLEADPQARPSAAAVCEQLAGHGWASGDGRAEGRAEDAPAEWAPARVPAAQAGRGQGPVLREVTDGTGQAGEGLWGQCCRTHC